MPRRLFALLALLGAVACGSGPTAPFIIDDTYVGLRVNGRVRTAAGAPVAGATVNVWVRQPTTCAVGYSESQVNSDSLGNFNRTVLTLNRPIDVCIWMEVIPPAGSLVSADTVSVPRVRLNTAFDSIAVDVVLPSPPAA